MLCCQMALSQLPFPNSFFVQLKNRREQNYRVRSDKIKKNNYINQIKRRTIIGVFNKPSATQTDNIGGFDFSEIVPWGSKNSLIDGFCAEFFAKSISENCNRLALRFEIYMKKN